jgi:sugar/nucleoside kinase (ribokinase family)
MSVLVVGSMAFDSVETPTDRRDDVIGGSGVFCSYAASYFSPVRLVGVVGEDWPDEFTQLLSARQINMAGLTVEKGRKTFRWHGRYMPNMNDRETLSVHLNVFGDFDPYVPEQFRDSKFVFLANGVPRVQLKVLEQMTAPKIVIADTMDLWIKEHRDDLDKLMHKITGLVLNDSEAILLADDENLVRAGLTILEMGPEFIVIKKGEHGAVFFSKNSVFALPAYPTDKVVDPTGAGDTFAGGMIGVLNQRDDISISSMKEAIAYGVVAASFNVEDFSLDRMKGVGREQLDARMSVYREMLRL